MHDIVGEVQVLYEHPGIFNKNNCLPFPFDVSYAPSLLVPQKTFVMALSTNGKS